MVRSSNATAMLYNASTEAARLPEDQILEELNSAEIRRLAPLFVYLALIAVWGIFGNAVVLHKYRTCFRKSCYRLFILWLSAINIFICAIDIPLTIATLTKEYTLEEAWLCKLSRATSLFCSLSSCFVLFFICIDRYRTECYPDKWQIPEIIAKVMCATSIFLAVLFTWPSLLLFGKKSTLYEEYNVTGTECSIADSASDTDYPIVAYTISIFASGCSMLVMLCLYALIVRALYKRAKQAAETQTKNSYNTEETMARKRTGLMFLITLSYILSYVPVLLLALIRETKSDFLSSLDEEGRVAYKFFLWSYYINCAVHPVIYGLMGTTRRASCRRLFSYCKCTRD